MTKRDSGSGGFFSKLFGNKKSDNSVPVTNEKAKVTTLKLSDDSSHTNTVTPIETKLLENETTKLNDDNSNRKKSLTRSTRDNKNGQTLKEYNKKVGSLQKYILKFQYVEEAYELIEKSFVDNSNQNEFKTNNDDNNNNTSSKMDDKMKKKCNISYLTSILNWLGFPLSSNIVSTNKINEIFGKDINSKEELITFKRLLVGTGELFFEIDEYRTKNNLEKFDISDNDKIERFGKLSKGFNIVKNMFDTIDINGDGEITYQEFTSSFMTLVRDEKLVNSRMKELDYNNDGEITFREFMHGIGYWIGFNEETHD